MQKQIRILITADPEIPVPPKYYGGIERVIGYLVKGLKARGYIVGLVANSDSTAKADKLFPWPGCTSRDATDLLKNTLHLTRVVKKYQPDIVHSFSRLFYMIPIMHARIPKLMSYQRQPTTRTVSISSRLAGDSLSFTGLSNFICNIGKGGGGEWRTIYNFIETDTYAFRANVPDDAPLIFLGRIERIKGAHTAIKIARRSGKRLIIAGNHSALPHDAEYWKNEILPNIGKDRIEYVGPVDDAGKNELLGGAAALILPVEWDEPFGIVFIEALACGTPVISCPRGAVPEIIRNGVDGYLVSNVEEGCEAIKNIGKINRQGCRERVENSFSSKVVINQYAELYKSFLWDKNNG